MAFDRETGFPFTLFPPRHLLLSPGVAEVSAELLQAIVHQRYKLRRSIVVTSNRVVQDWGKYLGNATMGSTILDRLMHRCSMLDFE